MHKRDRVALAEQDKAKARKIRVGRASVVCAANAGQDYVESLLTLEQTLNSGGGVLELRHLPDFDSGAYGAGIVEISIDGGSSWSNVSDFLPFLANGYTGSVATFSYSTGTRSFDRRGTSPGYRTSLIDLSSLEGADFRLRLRKVSGYPGIGSAPWDIDRIRVYSCRQPGPPPAAALISPSGSAELQAVYE